MAITKEQAIDILDKFDFFQGQRAGRELWNDKPFEVQEQDIKDFSNGVALLKEYISDVVPKSEVEWLYQQIDNYSQEVMYHDDITKMKVDEAKSEVAREIFEEIEEIFNKRIAFYTDMAKQSKFTEKYYAETMIKNCKIYLQEISELKKKYTEGK